MRERLEVLKEEATSVIHQAQSLDELRELKVRYLGKKGELTGVLRGMKDLPPEERPVIGSMANEVRGYLEELIAGKEKELEEAVLQEQINREVIDVSLPGIKPEPGTLHPLQLIIEQMEDIFVGMGFEIAEGPEVETDQFNFEMLNLPKGHPPGHAGLFLHHSGNSASDPYIRGTGSNPFGKRRTGSGADYCSWKGVPAR